MTSHESPGLVLRLLRALGGVLQRGILGKSADAYMKQFTGSDEYWGRIIAAQLGWPQQLPPKADPVRSRSSSDTMVRAGPGVRDNAPRPLEEPGFEPVHGWTRRQFDGYLARNPGYRSTYEAALQKCGGAASLGINGSPINWFGLQRMNHDKAASNTEPNGPKQARESQATPLCSL